MRALLILALLFAQAADAARGITGSTDKLVGPSTALPLTGSISVREYHTWSQNDNTLHILIETYTGGDNYFQVIKTSDNHIAAVWSIASGALRIRYALTGDYTLNANAWNVITVTYTSTVNTYPILYVNGTSVGVTDGPGGTGIVGSTSTSPDPWNFGNRGTGSFPWDGIVADIGVWNVVLSGSDVTALNACGAHPSAVPSGLVNQWNLAGSSLVAQAGGVDLTATGTTTEADQTCSSVAPVTHRTVIM